MKPYYEAGGIQLYLGDCREVLPTLKPDSVGMILTDPPYGQQWQSSWRTQRFDVLAGDDDATVALEGLQAALGVLRPKRHLYVFGRFDLSGLPLASSVELIWDKGIIGSGDLSLPWGPAHEVITFAAYYPAKAAREYGGGNLAARLRQGSVLRCQRLNSRQVTDHPTEKPVELLRQLIESSSLIGETVLDPFAGSGSSMLAAQLEGRKAIGIEVDEKFAEVAARRLSQQVLPLFEEVTA